MKWNLKTISFVFLTSSLILASCKKEGCTDPEATNYSEEAKKDDGSCQFETPQADAQVLMNFFANNQTAAVQTFTIDATAASSITGSQGTVFNFYANSFVDASGNDVTGNVTIELIEIYGKKDMMFLNKQTIGNNNGTLEPLISGGEFKVTASQNGNEVFLKDYYQYSADVQAPNGVDANMEIFYQSSPGDDTLVWSAADSSLIWGQGTVYNAYFDSLGWVNCDYFMGQAGPYTEVDIEVPNGLNNQNCAMFISFDGYNSLTNVYGYSNSVFSTGPSYSLPVGMNIHIIALAFINNTPHAAIVPVTIVDNHYEVIGSLTATTEAQLTQDIQNLP
ncbi:hypothetical protein K6119_04005 [Paracrocinitomix mangrovi]|uniref:hypothetical protein n=1 Tax=Paracrocinitomix mangrovi TaxID=2862509 RepID=UPI001C8E1849|nr:hypothetical protein [Paracrocinitomix mangrovi]UKN02676.1 hypothetical protein K6119_04005 [Paracrocinitomix mangrovi]